MPFASQCAPSVRRAALPVVFAIFALPPSASPGQERIDVDDHRPLHAATMELEKMVGYPIHYEDPPYAHEDDLQDVSTAAQRAEVPGYRLIVPKRGKLSYLLPADIRSPGIPHLATTVSGLVEEHNAQGLPGTFRTLSEGNFVYVVPVRIKGKDGREAPVKSPMEIRLPPFSIDSPEARLINVIERCTTLMSEASGVRIVPGSVPIGPPGSFPFSFQGGTARDVFAQINRHSQRPGAALSYQLLYDPKLGYMLNTRLVKRKMPVGAQGPSGESPEKPEVDSGAASRFFVRPPHQRH